MATNALERGERSVDVVRLPRDEPSIETEVLVVGAGPAGLAAALELRLHGVDVLVADGATEATLVRAGAMGHTARVVELFRRWGVADRIRDGWTVPPEWHTGHEVVTSLVGHRLDGRSRRFRGERGSTASAEDAIRRPQTVLQRAFLDRLGELDARVSGGWAWIGAEPHDDHVDSTLEHVASGERRTVRSRYVVGADGSHSAVRRWAGIEREGAYATERMVRYVVRVDGPYPAPVGWTPSATNVVVNDRYSGFLAALDDRHWRVYAGPFPVDAPVPDEATLAAHARHAFGGDVELSVVAVHPFYPSKRIAERFVAGRAVLVGDAAHVRAPGGNLGEGLGDVVNLGWKLAAVLRGTAPASLLDSYDAERRPHNHRIADFASARTDASRAAVEAARTLGFPSDDDVSPAAAARRRQLADLLGRDARPAPGTVFDERYDASPIVPTEPGAPAWDPHAYVDLGLPGHRAPDGAIDPFGGRLYDRVGVHHVLLALTPAARDAAPAIVAEAAASGVVLEVVALVDADAFDVYGRELVLVRPDHHVAWRGSVGDDVRAALDVAFARAPIAATLDRAA